MGTLDDKLLGEKVHNYCSSSEDENESNDSDKSGDEEECTNGNQNSAAEPPLEPPPINKWKGSSTNTGPKGVINDWKDFRQLEMQKQAAAEQERIDMIKKMAITCKSALDEEREKAKETDPDLSELLDDDDFLVNYQKLRMKEMLRKKEALPTFGKVQTIQTKDAFLEAIDKEHKEVCVIVHVYSPNRRICDLINDSFDKFAGEYANVKFCRVLANLVGLSVNFSVNGIPCILVYKGGQVIGNFVKIDEELGETFYAEDLEQFLIEHGMLTDRTCVPKLLNNPSADDSE